MPLRDQSYMFLLASSTLFTHLWIFWNHYNSLMGPIRSRYPKTVMESIHTHTHKPEVPNGRTFSLDITFLKSQASTRAALKEFYRSITHCDERLTHCSHEVPPTVTGFFNTDKSSYPNTGLNMPLWLQEVEGPRISRQSAYEGGKVVSPTHQPPLPPGRYSWYSFMLQAEQPQGHSATRRIKSIKNPNNPVGNRTRYLPAYSTVP